MNKRAALYIRVSTLEQAEKGYSIPAQKEALAAYAKQQGYEVVETYVDDGFTGSNMHRPGLTRMLDHIKKRLIDVVVVNWTDRLTRSTKDTLTMVEDYFIPNNVTLFSLHEFIDLSSPFGIAALTMSATFSELERKTIIERFKMGKDQAVRGGKYISTAPFGYRKNPATKYFDTVPEEAEMVVKLFDLYIQGYSLRKLYEYAKVHFDHPYFGNPMCCKQIIHRPMYSGYFRYKGELYKGINFSPIITYETWLKAQEQLKKNNFVRNHDTSPYLLTGLLVCAKCGNRYVGKMYKANQTRADGNLKSYEYRAYGCAARVKRDKLYHPAKCDNIIYNAEELEQLVEERVLNLNFTGFVGGAVVSGVIDQIKMDNAKLSAQLEKLLDLYMENLIDKATYTERAEKLEKQVAQNNMLIKNEESRIRETPTLTIDYLREQQARYPEMSQNERRKFLALIIKQIALNGNDIIFSFKVQ